MRDLNFEKWLQTTPEYKTLVFKHGERLFVMRDGEYEILTVRLAQRALSDSHQRSKDEYIELTQEWFSKGIESILKCDHVVESSVFSRIQKCSKCGLELRY